LTGSILVSSRIELRRARQFARAVGKLQITFKAVEAGHNRLGRTKARVRLANGLSEDRPNFGFQGPTMPRGPASEPFQDSIIQIPDGYSCHGNHPFLPSMLTESHRNDRQNGLGRRVRQRTEPVLGLPL